MDKQLQEKLNKFVADNRQNIIDDISALVDIRSVAEYGGDPAAPYGAGVQKAMHTAMALAEKAGLVPHDCEGHIAYAHTGDEHDYIGIISHVDAVPEGDGWNTDPYKCVEREGWLLGRGTEDDKGPWVLALYAVRFLLENKLPLRYGIRMLIGCDEEVGMSDIDYYLKNYPAPRFTFSPDAEFPVGHGEKGIFSADLTGSEPLSPVITELCGGVASNVVPDKAHVVLALPLDTVVRAAGKNDALSVSGGDGAVRVTANGIAGHAGSPYNARSAIVILCSFLCDSGFLSDSDRRQLSFIADCVRGHDGSAFGIECDDGIFMPLTCIGGTIKLADRLPVQNINIRYPTCIDGATLSERIGAVCAANGFSCGSIEDSAPHYIPADSPAIAALSAAFRAVTGRNDPPYVMSGGTYARHIPNAVAFGPVMPDAQKPDFVGAIHSKNEGLCIDSALEAVKVFAEALYNLQQTEL